jgi:arginine N-succinyltransferase
LLTSFGFEYQDRVDPFDGGPHFEAETDAILPVKNSFRATCEIAGEEEFNGKSALTLVCSSRDAFTPSAKFVAVQTLAKMTEKAKVEISQSAARLLKVSAGDDVWVYSLEE